MKISVYGAGNQEVYLDRLNLPETFGGSAPYGGSRLAIEYAQAGHDVILAEPDRSMLTEEHWNIVEDAGVKVTSDDAKAAKHAEIAVLFTPFGQKTFDIARNIIEHIPENGIIATTCTQPSLLLYVVLSGELKLKRPDIGISSLHPAAVPGTPQHEHYVISGETTEGVISVTDNQMKKLIDLAESCGKKPHIVAGDVTSAVSDMGSLITATTAAAIFEFYTITRDVIKATPALIDTQALISLQTISSLIETSGVAGMFKALPSDVLFKSTQSMKLDENQKMINATRDILSGMEEYKKTKGSELFDLIDNTEINPMTLVAPQELVQELRTLMGPNAAKGAITRCTRRMFE